MLKKHNLKKTLAFILSILMMFSLAACGSETDSGSATDSSAGEETKVLRVGMECAYAPFNWTQSDDSNGAVLIQGTEQYANGYDIMYAKKIADTLGYELEVYKIEWDGLIPALTSDKIDAIVAGMCMTDERKQSIDFTDIYYQADIVAITMKGSAYENATSLDDLAGVTTTSQLNTVWEAVLDQILDANITPGIDTVPGVIVSLTSGKSDVVTVDLPTALAAIAANPDIVLLDLSEGDFEVDPGNVDMGIGIKKGNTELYDAINSVVVTITEEDREAMMDEAIKVQPLSE